MFPDLTKQSAPNQSSTTSGQDKSSLGKGSYSEQLLKLWVPIISAAVFFVIICIIVVIIWKTRCQRRSSNQVNQMILIHIFNDGYIFIVNVKGEGSRQQPIVWLVLQQWGREDWWRSHWSCGWELRLLWTVEWKKIELVSSNFGIVIGKLWKNRGGWGN